MSELPCPLSFSFLTAALVFNVNCQLFLVEGF